MESLPFEPWMLATAAGAVLVVVIVILALRRGGGSSAGAGTLRRGLGNLFRRKPAFDDETREQLRETLIGADFGTTAADAVIEALGRKARGVNDLDALLAALREALAERLAAFVGDVDAPQPGEVVLIVGINGSGKTTSVARLAHRWKEQGKPVVIGAADTFRAAAAEQLEVWGERVGVRVVRQKAGADPAAVAFDTVQAAQAANAIALIDTAGRIHGDQGLMEELKKIRRVIGKAVEGAPQHVWLTLDASQGQTAIEQARRFHEAVGVTGLIVNKLDGEGMAGFVYPITEELGIPIIAIGVGEGMEDLEPFAPERFAAQIV
ncbi:MAG: signal recognition particle-docking protein FtsY [Candidatus Dadabacteria bacterium]|nr:MAG: signal recognition particle-docking protein FtsY [Candidatus Dadabacteria bacterium]